MPAGSATASNPLFSIVILAHNEEQPLPRLLYLLEECLERGGEVLLMDTGSTDGTVAIAKRRGCRVEEVHDRFDTILDAAQAAKIERFGRFSEGPLVKQGQRVFNFGEARQYAGSLASKDFVLQLDASDELSALDIEALNEWIASRRVSAFDYDQVYGAMSLRITRFYDRNRYHWEGRTHEVLVPIDGADFSTVSKVRCNSKQLVVHHNQQKKERNYLAGLAMQVLEHPEKPRWWHFLGRELFYDRWFESAIPVLEAHAKMEGAWPTERSQSWCFIGECLKALKRPAEAEEAYLRSLAIDPTRREPFLELAAVYSRRGEFENAVRWAREALAIPRTNAYPEVEANYTWRPHAFLYWNLFWLGQRDEAREHWEKFLSMVPEEHVPPKHARLFGQANKDRQGSISNPSATAAPGEAREPRPQKEP